jgi:hypothetical protein
MNKNITKFILVTAGAVLFNLLFWHEKLGLNTVLYDLFILSALFSLYPKSLRSGTVRWLVLGHLICLGMVVFHNTPLSKIGLITTLCLLVPFAEYVHRSAWFAGGSMLLNMIFMLAGYVETTIAGHKDRVKRKRKPLLRIIRFAIFPLLILLVFLIIYSSANDVFAQLVEQIGQQFALFFENFFDFFSPQRLLFFVLGLFITGAVLLKSRASWFSKLEENCSDALQRKRTSMKKRRKQTFYQLIEAVMGRFARGVLALKNENTTGIISLVLLNLLLFIVNIIDIRFLWFNFEYNENEPVYKMVHEGTELLIASIVLAMAILLFFFKGNLNFYRRNKWLKYGAYAWILQNVVLVISVCIRDYYYIAKHGLAYKRIGVLFFLLMVLIGLLTVFIKIAHKKTNYYLWRVNAWAGVIVLTLSTTIHWDEFIAGYNLQRKDRVALDIPFLLSLSDKTLPLLDQNKTALQKAEGELTVKIVNGKCITCYTELLLRRRDDFFSRQSQISWLSWNYSDDYTRKYFGENTTPLPDKHQ